MDSVVLLACKCGASILTPRQSSTARCPRCGVQIETDTGRERRRLAALDDDEHMTEVQ